MNIDAFIDEYLVSRSPATEKAYRSDLKKFAAFLAEQGLEVDAVRPKHIRACVNWLAARRNTRNRRRGLSEDTVKRHIAAVRAYYEWLRFTRTDLANPTAFFRFRRGRMRRKVLGIPADVVDRMCTTGDKKEAAIVLLFSRSGVRLSELIALDRKSFAIFPATAQAPAHAQLSIRGKGGKTRRVFVSQEAVDAVRNYLMERQDHDPALFLSSRGRRISKRTVQRIIKRLGAGSGCDDAHPHRLRHRFATDMLEGDMKVAVLQKLMGHEKAETTLSYVDALERNTARQYHAAMEMIHGADLAFGGPMLQAGRPRKRKDAALISPRNGRSRRKAAVPNAHSGRRRAA